MADAPWTPQRAEIIWIQHTPHAGKEMPGIHPMLVSSPESFNVKTRLVIGFPMTHAESNASNEFAVKVVGPKGEVAYILAFQPKSFDWHVRKATPHAWGRGHDNVLSQVLLKLDSVCQICPI